MPWDPQATRDWHGQHRRHLHSCSRLRRRLRSRQRRRPKPVARLYRPRSCSTRRSTRGMKALHGRRPRPRHTSGLPTACRRWPPRPCDRRQPPRVCGRRPAALQCRGPAPKPLPDPCRPRAGLGVLRPAALTLGWAESGRRQLLARHRLCRRSTTRRPCLGRT